MCFRIRNRRHFFHAETRKWALPLVGIMCKEMKLVSLLPGRAHRDQQSGDELGSDATCFMELDLLTATCLVEFALARGVDTGQTQPKGGGEF